MLLKMLTTMLVISKYLWLQYPGTIRHQILQWPYHWQTTSKVSFLENPKPAGNIYEIHALPSS